MNFTIPKEDIKHMIDEYYSQRNFDERINELKSKVDNLASLHAPVFDQLEKLTRKVEKIEEQKPATKAAFKARIIKKISRNAKEYMKNIVLSMIRKYEKISALQLREIIVEEQGLCSKSSFYRLLEEIEKEEEITVVQEGKEKRYLYKMSRTTYHRRGHET
jgi:biotin-(acetyl-CoA carboxylase) ligase